MLARGRSYLTRPTTFSTRHDKRPRRRQLERLYTRALGELDGTTVRFSRMPLAQIRYICQEYSVELKRRPADYMAIPDINPHRLNRVRNARVVSLRPTAACVPLLKRPILSLRPGRNPAQFIGGRFLKTLLPPLAYCAPDLMVRQPRLPRWYRQEFEVAAPPPFCPGLRARCLWLDSYSQIIADALTF